MSKAANLDVSPMDIGTVYSFNSEIGFAFNFPEQFWLCLKCFHSMASVVVSQPPKHVEQDTPNSIM